MFLFLFLPMYDVSQTGHRGVNCQMSIRITDYGHWRLLTTVYNQNSENVSRESGS